MYATMNLAQARHAERVRGAEVHYRACASVHALHRSRSRRILRRSASEVQR